MKKLVLATVLGLFGLVFAAPAHAGTISITVGGWGPVQFTGPVTPPTTAPPRDGYKGDTVEFQSFTFDLTLQPGTSTQQINTLLWTIDYTYGGTATDPEDWSDVTFNLNALRSMSSPGLTIDPLSQAGTLTSTWDNDFLSFSPGGTVSFFTQGYQVQIAPLGLEVAGSNFAGDNPWVQPDQPVYAQITVKAVPDSGSTLALVGCALVGLGALRRKFNV